MERRSEKTLKIFNGKNSDPISLQKRGMTTHEPTMIKVIQPSMQRRETSPPGPSKNLPWLAVLPGCQHDADRPENRKKMFSFISNIILEEIISTTLLLLGLTIRAVK